MTDHASPPTSLDRYVTLGNSGLRVSPFCLGAMTFGTEWGWGSDVELSRKVMDTYIDAGGNFIDTANMYTKGHSEVIMGEHLCAAPAKRDRLVIATKFMSGMHQGDPNSGGAGRKAIVGACEESLRRLQTDYIDLYWMHFWDHHTPMEETMRAFDELVQVGKIRYVGFSDTPAWKCAQAQMLARFKGYEPLCALQIEYSLIERTVEDELIPMAREMGMGVTPWSPLKGGILTGKFTRDTRPQEGTRVKEDNPNLNERSYAIIDELVAIAGELGSTPAKVALAWVQGRDGVASTIIGASKLHQLKDNLGALQVELSAEQLARLDEVSKREPIFPQKFLPFTRGIFQAGTTINGEPSEAWPMAPQNDEERW